MMMRVQDEEAYLVVILFIVISFSTGHITLQWSHHSPVVTSLSSGHITVWLCFIVLLAIFLDSS
jgi:hypothetical protein